MFCTVERLVVVVADVLLHLVEHDERERQLPVGRRLEPQDVVHHIEHLVVGDVPRRRRELRLEQVADLLDRVARGRRRRRGAPWRSPATRRGRASPSSSDRPSASTAARTRVEVAVLLSPDREAGARRTPRAARRSRTAPTGTPGAQRRSSQTPSVPAADHSPPSRFPAVDSSVRWSAHIVGQVHEARARGRRRAARHRATGTRAPARGATCRCRRSRSPTRPAAGPG